MEWTAPQPIPHFWAVATDLKIMTADHIHHIFVRLWQIKQYSFLHQALASECLHNNWLLTATLEAEGNLGGPGDPSMGNAANLSISG